MIIIRHLRMKINERYRERVISYTQSLSVISSNHLMPYREIMAVCSDIQQNHVNALCG